MEVTRYKISSYLRAEDSFHVARKSLARKWPDHAHDHDFYEVFLVENGEVDHWINQKTTRLSKGHLVFVRPFDVHAFRADAKSGCDIINVMFRVETARHFLLRYSEDYRERFFDSKSRFPETHLLQGARLEGAVNVARDLATAKQSLARLDEFLLTLTNRLLPPKSSFGSGVPQWLAEACEAARHPEIFKLGAPGFIAVAGRSHEHVCRTCRATLGLTPSAYINRVRSEFAAERLARSTDGIPEIASQCGIENLSHFYRVFRNHYGTTPRIYRLRHQRSPF
ncbi:MAG: AraC family transcriptional regulator [Pseudomonadota bacterium]